MEYTCQTCKNVEHSDDAKYCKICGSIIIAAVIKEIQNKFITGRCNKCDNHAVFNIGNETKEGVENWMKKTEFGHCAVGWHVELGPMASYYELDWSNTFDSRAEAQRYNKLKENKAV